MAFVFKVETTSTDETFILPCQDEGMFNADIDWGDGETDLGIITWDDVRLTHTYATPDTHTITVTGTFPNIYFNNVGDKLKIVEIVDLGDVGWTSLNNAFNGCANLVSVGGATANTSAVTNTVYMFRSCSSLTTVDTSLWDTSLVTNMVAMFHNCSSLPTLDVSDWDTSAVTTMVNMFRGCSILTGLDVSGWDTSLVTGMSNMFRSCTSMTGLVLHDWDISSATTGADFLLDSNSAITDAEYDLILENWGQQAVQPNVIWHFGDAKYTTDYYSDDGTGTPLAVQPSLYAASSLTNLMTYSDDVSQWVSIGNVLSIAQDAVGLTGAANSAWTITADGVGNGGYHRTKITTDDGSKATWVWYISKSSTSADIELRGRYSGGTVGITYSVVLDPTTGILSASTFEAEEVMSVGNFWVIYAEGTQPNDGSTSARTYVYPGTDSYTGTAILGNAEIYADKTIAQARGAGPIITAGSSVTTSEVEIKYDIANHADDQGCYYAEVTPFADSVDNPTQWGMITHSISSGMLYYGSGTYARSYDGTSITVATSQLTKDVPSKVGVAYGDNALAEPKKITYIDDIASTELEYFAPWGSSSNLLILDSLKGATLIRNIQRYDLPYEEAKGKLLELMA